MFERNRIDNVQEVAGVSAEITLDDGRTLTGRFAVPMSRTVFDILNGPGSFIEFEPFDGPRQMLAKSILRSVRLTSPPKLPDLARRLRDIDGFDPFVVLGVKSGASRDDIRAAYHSQAKCYHPDRYANAELPEEVRDYLSGMARRINAAYAALDAMPAAKRPAERPEPVYSRSAR